MSCPYCRGIGEHDYRCPLWQPSKKQELSVVIVMSIFLKVTITLRLMDGLITKTA